MAINEQLMEFNEKRSVLLEIVSESETELRALKLEKDLESLAKLEKKLSSDTFKVMVMGNFKNGKSTFINSLLGQEVLPAYATPATAVISEVKYGETKKAVLYFRDPLPPLEKSVQQAARDHIAQSGGKNVPPMEISVDELDDYICIPEDEERDDASRKSPFEKAELCWPLDLLKNNVEIVDSPGLEEDPERTAVTLSYLGQADAVLFTFDANHFVSAKELEYMDTTLKGFGFEKKSIFAVLNRFDTVHGESNRKRVMDSAEKNLKDRAEHIFYTSAIDALEGKLEGDEQKLKSSNIPALEESLAEYLTQERGRVKLSSPSKELLNILREKVLNGAIPQSRSLYAMELEVVREKYEQAKPDIRELENKRELILQRADAKIQLMENDIRRFAMNYINDFPTLINGWILDYSPTTKVKMLKPKESSEKLVKEILDYVNVRIDNELRAWTTGPLTDLLTDKAEELKETLEQYVNEFYIKLDEIVFDTSGVEASGRNVPGWQRVVAMAGGWLISGAGGVVVGAQEGLTKEFAKTAAKQLAVQVGVYTVAGIIGMLNPVVMIGTVAVQVISAISKQESRAITDAKERLSAEYCNLINKGADEMCERIVTSAIEQISAVRNTASDSLSMEITQMEERLQNVIAEMELGKSNIEKQRAILDASEEKIRALEARLTEFVFQLLK